MNINIVKIIIVAVIVAIIAVVLFLSMPWIILMIAGQVSPDPPKPEITYAEFPFRLEYEINEEYVVDEDIFICEYDGIGFNTGEGKYRKWKTKLASGREKILLYRISDTKYIYYTPGHAKYYMGDMEEYVTFRHSFPNARLFQLLENGLTMDGEISAKELMEEYDIKLLKWEPSPPIKNTFK